MTAEECFATWAPDQVVWSEWAKPVAFVHIGGVLLPDAGAVSSIGTPPAIPLTVTPQSAVVVDLPGSDAVAAGVALAERGFRPVPLFNGTAGPSPVIDVQPIARALVHGAERLQSLSIPDSAAPAFLLDARRHDPAIVVRAGHYDNRWVTLPQDFPSGALLASRGLRHATLLHDNGLTIRPDLAHVLRRWQEAGIEIRVVDVKSGQVADRVEVPKPSGFRLAWYAAIALLGLRRSNVGGFGSMIPEHTARPGFYG